MLTSRRVSARFARTASYYAKHMGSGYARHIVLAPACRLLYSPSLCLPVSAHTTFQRALYHILFNHKLISIVSCSALKRCAQNRLTIATAYGSDSAAISISIPHATCMACILSVATVAAFLLIARTFNFHLFWWLLPSWCRLIWQASLSVCLSVCLLFSLLAHCAPLYYCVCVCVSAAGCPHCAFALQISIAAFNAFHLIGRSTRHARSCFGPDLSSVKY